MSTTEVATGRSKKINRRLVAAVLLVAVLGAGGWAANRSVQQRRDRALAAAQRNTFRVVQVERSKLVEQISALGSLEPVATSTIHAIGPGHVRRVAVKEGDFVQQGAVLFELEASELEFRVKQATAGLLSARANLQRLLAPAAEYEVQQAENSVKQAEITLQEAKADLEKDEMLFAGGAISRQQLEQTRTRVTSAELQLRNAEAKLAQLLEPPREEEVAAARAQVAQAEASLEAAERDLAAATVRAPIAGTVVKINVQPGEAVATNQELAAIYDVRRLYATVPVNEIDIAKVAPGQRVTLKVDALSGRMFNGQIVKVSQQGQVRDNIVTYQVTAEIPNPNGVLRPGMTIDAAITVAEKENALVVPLEALSERGGRATVMVPGENDGPPTPKPVTVGIRSETAVEIVSGLEEGDRVVVMQAGRAVTFGGPGGPGGNAIRTPGGGPVMIQGGVRR